MRIICWRRCGDGNMILMIRYDASWCLVERRTNVKQEGPWDKTNFPARKIYERVLPEICERLAGDVPYWRSSPYGGKTSNDVTVGDTHIWSGKILPLFYYCELPLKIQYLRVSFSHCLSSTK